MSIETSVKASDRRSAFASVKADDVASGRLSRDLFPGDDGGWFEGPAVLDRLGTGKVFAS